MWPGAKFQLPLVKSHLNSWVSNVVVCRDAGFSNRFRSYVKLSKEIVFQFKKRKTIQRTLWEKLSLHQANVCLRQYAKEFDKEVPSEWRRHK